MQVQVRPIDSIQPYGKNPRLNDGAVETVARSLKEFNFRQPIVVDKDNVIVVGHTRWKAAKQLGMTEVPVHVAHDLTPEQAKAYRLADNQTATIAEWDMDLLPLELLELKVLSIDMTLLGWSPEELSEIMAPQGNAGLTDPDEIPAPPDAATTQPGDIWILGEHRLMCGNSAVPEDVDRLLAGAPIHLVNTDPPYNVAVEPRSNNAIAAGNSSFTSGQKMHLQKFDKERDSTSTDVIDSGQEQAIIALINEPTVRKAAEVAGISEPTLYRWMKEPEFARAYREARKESFRQSISLTQKYAPAAIQTLMKIMQDPVAPPSAKVSASTALLKFSRESIELDDLASRVEALEHASSQPATPLLRGAA